MTALTSLFLIEAILFLTTLCKPASCSVLVEKLDEAKSHVTQKDYRGAYKRFKKMARHGCPYSQCALGIMHERGVGAQKDSTRAIYWYKKSARNGFADAQHRLGKLYLAAGNIEEATHWLKQAAEHGVVEAEYLLGKIYVDSGAEEIAQEGRRWLRKAADHGYGEAIALVEKIPNVPTPANATLSNPFAEGMGNVQQSWLGYSTLTKALEDGESQ